MNSANQDQRARFTDLLDAVVPVQVASMPGVSTAALVAAVCEAGGVGMLPAPMLSPEALDHALDDVIGMTSRAFGVNFLMPFLDLECVRVAARRARLVEFFYGEPRSSLVDEVHAAGALVSWQVGSTSEAEAASEAGCDIIVAQGTEAGGHVRGQLDRASVLAAVLDAVNLPVLAAGGISSASDVADALARGASGVRVGTRFIAASEAGAHPSYVDALIGARASDTCLTEAFSVMWPDAPHRVLRSSIDLAESLTDDIVGETRVGAQTIPVPRLSVICPSAETTGRTDAMALYAGTSVDGILRVQPAAEILAELASRVPR